MSLQPSQRQQIDWAALVPEHEWAIYRKPLVAVLDRGLPFAIGGGLAFTFHSLRARYTRDVDLYVRREDSGAFIELLNEHGFEDYFPRLAYDRSWIYRAFRQGVIIDVIWQMANGKAQVDASWLSRAVPMPIMGLALRALAPEELIWAKIFVLQRDRCDWPDILNIINTQGPSMDWQHLIARMDGDWMLLSGILNVYRWLCPHGSTRLPQWIWEKLSVQPPSQHTAGDRGDPKVLLDTRDWFGPTVTSDPCIRDNGE